MSLERLEDRQLLSGVMPNDLGYPQQWSLHNTGQAGGPYDLDIDAPGAWSVTTGSTANVVAVLDSGIDYTDPDLYLNIWLNSGEIPAGVGAGLSDTDSDGLISFRDLNAPANSGFVTDLNGNGYVDGGDLLHDPRWADELDGDGNGRVDDLIGWDSHDGDNDPQPVVSDGVYQSHGTDQAKSIGAMTNNGLGKAGINWNVRMIPVRIRADALAISNTAAAAGIDYAVSAGATISNNSWRTAGGGYVYSQEVFDAINRSRQAGHLFVAAAGNDSTDNDTSPFYPASYTLDNIISATRVDEFGQKATNFGLNSVDLGVAATGGSSNASSHTTGVAALLKSVHPDWGYAQVKARLLGTVEPLASLAGQTVTGGILNATAALATTSISVSDPTVTEGDAGTSQLVFTVTRVGDDPGSVTLNWSTVAGTAAAGTDYVAASGQVTFLPGGANTQTVTISVVGDHAAEPSETFFVSLAIVSGNAVLADADGRGTVLDTDTDTDTKFYVVNDATTNQTYEYAASGSSVENYTLNSGNTAPRGAASTAAGDRVWVVDANKKVYVYDTAGALLGSWTAGSLAGNAQVEGIATNGTDVWIVDARQDRVYGYTGAAGRLDGSQNAASSFALNSGNRGPKDVVTDGANLWVVNNSTTDKVFQYTLTGSLVGSWTIAGAGSSPTGITLDPSGGGNLWVVDSGTDRVYQFDNARSRTSGSQSPSMSFALAAGNTNPQGIADPPVGAPLSAVAPHRDVPIRPRVVIRDRISNAGPASSRPRTWHLAQPEGSRRVAGTFPPARGDAIIIVMADQIPPTIPESLTPAGPRSLRPRFNLSR